eukprot:1867624-Prymnesium_polylepis.1
MPRLSAFLGASAPWLPGAAQAPDRAAAGLGSIRTPLLWDRTSAGATGRRAASRTIATGIEASPTTTRVTRTARPSDGGAAATGLMQIAPGWRHACVR